MVEEQYQFFSLLHIVVERTSVRQGTITSSLVSKKFIPQTNYE